MRSLLPLKLLACFLFVMGCRTPDFGVYVTSLHPEDIETFNVVINAGEIGRPSGHELGPLLPRVESSVFGISGSSPESVAMRWSCGGKQYAKTLQLSKAASDLVKGDSERMLVFISEAQIPLLIIDVRKPGKPGEPNYYDCEGKKLNAVEADVVAVLRGFDRKNLEAESLNQVVKTWEDQSLELSTKQRSRGPVGSKNSGD